MASGHPKFANRNPQSRRTGFTLIEVLLVLVIIGVIGAMVLPQVLGRQQKAMIDACRGSIKGVEGGLDLYKLDHQGTYPQGGQEALEQLKNPVDLDGNPVDAYIEKDLDPWNQKFFYEYPNTKGGNTSKPAIWSAGPNGKNESGGGDDINNWDAT
jgi:general secretion pathway protein G